MYRIQNLTSVYHIKSTSGVIIKVVCGHYNDDKKKTLVQKGTEEIED